MSIYAQAINHLYSLMTRFYSFPVLLQELYFFVVELILNLLKLTYHVSGKYFS